MRRAPKRGALETFAAYLLLLLMLQHGDAFFLANYQQQQPQQAQPAAPQPQNPLGFLPNGYSLAAGSPLPLQPPQYQQQLLQPSSTNQLYASNPSEAASAATGNESDDGSNTKQFDGQYGRASSPSQQQAEPRLDRLGPTNSMSDREASPVFRFTGQPLNSSSVKLVWSMTTGYQADFFEIRYGPIPDTESKSVALNGTARELTISLLQPNEMYHFKLQAYINDLPVWKPLLQVIRTPAAGNAKPGQLQEDRELTPLGVKAEAKSNQTIQLSWVEQERPAHLTNAKRVNYIRYHVDPSLTQEAAANGTSNSSSTPLKYHYLNTTEAANRDNRIIIQKLKPATEYAFAVRTVYFSPDGKKALKTSPFSMDTLAKTFDLEPSAPRNFSMMPVRLSAEESRGGELIPKLELTWASPESPNGQLKGFVILYAHDLNQPDEKWARIYVNDSNIFNWYVSNLRPGSSYYFKMRAINQRGQSGDTETRMFMAPPSFPGSHLGQPPPIPANNILMLIVICLVAILFVLFLVVSRLFCRSHSSNRKLAAQRKAALHKQQQQQGQNDKLVNGYGMIAPPNHLQNGSSSTVTARVGTLARRSNRQQAGDKPDFWISAMDQQAAAAAASSDIKSNLSEKSNTSDNINMQAMVSIRRDSPQHFTTQATQLAPMLPEYRFTPSDQQQQLMQQMQQQQSHYHTGHQFPVGALGYDQMDNATASALMTLSKRQQQQLQKYHFQFSSAGAGGTMNPSGHSAQAASPHQQPPPPPPLNIEQQQAQQQQQQIHNQTLYGTHGPLNSSRSLRLHRPTVYDPVSGSFVQPTPQDPPNYNSHLNSMLGAAHQQLQSFNNNALQGSVNTSTGSNTLQFHHPHSTSTLMSRRSTNTLRSFQSAAGAGSLYGQLGNANSFVSAGQNNVTTNQGPQLLQSHQAVINQLNESTYPSMPLKHVSAVRPQIMSSLEDQIEMELAEKQAEQQQQQQQQQQQDQNS